MHALENPRTHNQIEVRTVLKKVFLLCIVAGSIGLVGGGSALGVTGTGCPPRVVCADDDSSSTSTSSSDSSDSSDSESDSSSTTTSENKGKAAADKLVTACNANPNCKEIIAQ